MTARLCADVLSLLFYKWLAKTLCSYFLLDSKPGFVLSLFLNFLQKPRLLFLQNFSYRKNSVVIQFIIAYHISLVNVQTNYCHNKLLILDIKQLNKIMELYYLCTLKALLDGQGRFKMYYGMSRVKKQLLGKRSITTPNQNYTRKFNLFWIPITLAIVNPCQILQYVINVKAFIKFHLASHFGLRL